MNILNAISDKVRKTSNKLLEKHKTNDSKNTKLDLQIVKKSVIINGKGVIWSWNMSEE